MCDQQRLRLGCAYAQSDQSLCKSLENPMTVKLLAEQHLEFLRLKGGYTGSSESTLVKIPHCCKSHVTAHICFCVRAVLNRPIIHLHVVDNSKVGTIMILSERQRRLSHSFR